MPAAVKRSSKKASAKKVAASKKAVSKKAAPPAKAATPRGGKAATVDPKDVVRMRDTEELSFKEIGTQVGLGRSLVEVLYMRGHLAPQDFVSFKNEEDLGAKAVRMRDGQLLSWGQIAARTNVSEARLRTLYSKSSGKDNIGNRIGKGGRYPNGQTPPKAATPVKKAAKASKSTKASAQENLNPGRKHIADMDLDELKTRIEGHTMKVGRSGRPRSMEVKTVQKLAKGELHFSDKKGAAHAVKLSDIVRVSA